MGFLRDAGSWILLVPGFLFGTAAAQDSARARKLIEELCSRKYEGRGYINKGALKAAGYLEQQLRNAGVQPWKGSYIHHFNMPVNTLPVTEVKLQGRTLKPGIEYLIDEASPGWKGSFVIRVWSWADTLTYPGGPWRLQDSVAAVPEAMLRHPLWGKRVAQMRALHPVPVQINAVPRLPAWGVAQAVDQKVTLLLRADRLQHGAQLNLRVKNEFRPEQTCSNVIGFIPGTHMPDSLLVLTAHYDHLGRMGKAIFPGANDNASGVAMVMDLARGSVLKPLPYSVVVVFFAAEEAGLLGSAALIRDRVLPLNRIRFLLNLDLMGTGETGMTVVNATIFPREFSILDSLNRQFQFLPAINKRGKAANSDHYFFTEAGVPSFFGYLSGPRPAYHSTDDVPQTLTLHGYVHTYRLYRSFLEHLTAGQ
ncbi:MAG: M28 family peptidase [Bacteroidetes bacterium]|nr:M28 family peptidase [Bacteroidota bacterium]